MTASNGYRVIGRGPMGGDQYARFHNGVFRDTRLTPNAACVFGFVGTQTEGWKTSIAGIARDRKLGESLVKAALACLKKHHYLVSGQDRNPDGTVGEGWYFITDLPAQLAAAGVTDDAIVSQAVAEAVAEWIEHRRRSEPVSPETPSVSPAQMPLRHKTRPRLHRVTAS